MRAGLPPPEVQYRVVDEYEFVLARIELAYPAARLAIEYDGSDHYERLRGERDRQRDTELAARGWLTVRVGRRHAAESAQTIENIRTLLRQRSPEIDTRVA